MRRIKISCFHFLCFVLIIATLAGCETMSKKECLSADWRQVGYQAGREGKARSYIEDIAESCAKTNVTPDRRLYFSGWELGVREYCTPQHGFDMGKNGTGYRAVCPPESASRFEAAYQRGHRIYEARQNVAQLEDKRHQQEERLEKAATDDQKKHIRDELAELDRQLRYARDALQLIESETRPPY